MLVPVARVGVVPGGRVLVEDAVVLVQASCMLLVELRGAVHDDGVAVDVEPKHGRRRGGGPLEAAPRATLAFWAGAWPTKATAAAGSRSALESFIDLRAGEF